MPYSPGVSAFQRNSFVGGLYNNGLSYYSGADPASYFPFVVADILNNQTPQGYTYHGILTDRLTTASDPFASDTPVSQWTPEQQSIYGKIFEAPTGPPTPTINGPGGPATAPKTEESPDPMTGLTPTESGKIATTIAGIPGGWNLTSNLVIIVIAILLLAIAAYSIVGPGSGTRERIARVSGAI